MNRKSKIIVFAVVALAMTMIVVMIVSRRENKSGENPLIKSVTDIVNSVSGLIESVNKTTEGKQTNIDFGTSDQIITPDYYSETDSYYETIA